MESQHQLQNEIYSVHLFYLPSQKKFASPTGVPSSYARLNDAHTPYHPSTLSPSDISMPHLGFPGIVQKHKPIIDSKKINWRSASKFPVSRCPKSGKSACCLRYPPMRVTLLSTAFWLMATNFASSKTPFVEARILNGSGFVMEKIIANYQPYSLYIIPSSIYRKASRIYGMRFSGRLFLSNQLKSSHFSGSAFVISPSQRSATKNTSALSLYTSFWLRCMKCTNLKSSCRNSIPVSSLASRTIAALYDSPCSTCPETSP